MVISHQQVAMLQQAQVLDSVTYSTTFLETKALEDPSLSPVPFRDLGRILDLLPSPTHTLALQVSLDILFIYLHYSLIYNF